MAIIKITYTAITDNVVLLLQMRFIFYRIETISVQDSLIRFIGFKVDLGNTANMNDGVLAEGGGANNILTDTMNSNIA